MACWWVDVTNRADLQNHVAQGEVRLDDLSPNTLFNIGVAYYPDTIPAGQHARNTIIQRFCHLLLQIRAKLDQQGARRRAAAEGEQGEFCFAEFLV